MARPRDTQRKKVYTAETFVFKKHNEEFKNFHETSSFVHSVYKKLGDKRDIVIKDGRGTSWARGGNYPKRAWLNLPRWSRNKGIILHEIAHTITPNEYASHGPEFCRNFVDLVALIIGKKEARDLIDAFRTKKAKVAPANMSNVNSKCYWG